MIVSFIANQLKLLNKLLPLRHMTQLWNTYIRPHLQYVSPILYTQSKASQVDWEQLRRWSLKLTLCLSKTLSNKVIDRIWELFDFKTPFSNQLKQYQGLIRKGDAYQIFLNQQYEDFRSFRRKRLRIQQFPNYGYLNRHKFNLMLCKSCSNKLRWNFDHIKIHNLELYNQYQDFDKYIEERIDKEDIEVGEKYQDNLCSKIKILNQKLLREIEKHGIPYKVNE